MVVLLTAINLYENSLNLKENMQKGKLESIVVFASF